MKHFFLVLLFSFGCWAVQAQLTLLPVQSNENGLWGLLTYSGTTYEGFTNCTTAVSGSFALVQTLPFDSFKVLNPSKPTVTLHGYNFKTCWQNRAILAHTSGNIYLYDWEKDTLIETLYTDFAIENDPYLRLHKDSIWSYCNKDLQVSFQHVRGDLSYHNKSFTTYGDGMQLSLDSLGKVSHEHPKRVLIHHGWYPAVVEEHPTKGFRLSLPKGFTTSFGWKNALWIDQGLIRLLGAKKDLIVDTNTLDSFRVPQTWRIEKYGNGFKVRQKNKIGLLSAKGAILYPPDYQDIRISENYIFLLQKEGWGLAQLDGTQLLACKYLEISEIDGRLLLLNKSGTYGLSNVKGEQLLSTTHQKILVMGLVIKAFKSQGVTLYQLNKDLRITDSLHFNQVINSTYETASKENLLISSKDTVALVPNRTGRWYYSERYGSWRLYLEEKGKSIGKHHDIDLPNNSRRLISSNYHAKPLSTITFDQAYTTNMTQGLFDRGRNSLSVPKKYVSVFGYDEAANGSQRCLAPDGTFRCYAPELKREYKMQATYIDTGFRCGYRVNFSGTWVSGDSVSFRPIGTKYSLLASANLIDKNKPFNAEWLTQKTIGIKGGTWLFMSADGSISKRYQYQWIENCGSYFTIVKKDNDWKLAKSPGTSPVYIFNNNKLLRRRKVRNNSYFVYSKKDSLYGFIDRNGALVKPPAYETCSTFVNGRLAVRELEGWNFVDSNFQRVSDITFSQVRDFSFGRATVKQHNFWGIINEAGDLVQGFDTYFGIRPFEDSHSWGVKRGGYFLIDLNGTQVLERSFEAVTSVRYGVSLVARKKSKNRALIDVSGQKLTRAKYQPLLNFNEDGIAIVMQRKRTYLLQTNGKKLIKKGFKVIRPIQNDWYVAQSKSSHFAISRKGNVVALPQLYRYQNYFKEGKIVLSLNDKFGYADTNGQVLVEPIYSAVSDYNEGRALVQLSAEEGACIDAQGKELFRFLGVFKHGFENGLAIVKGTQGWYYINTQGKNAFDTYYGNVSSFINGRAKVLLADGWHLINTQGEVLHQRAYHHIDLDENGIFRINELSGKGLLSNGLEVLIEPIMTRIEFMNDQIIRAEHYDKTYYYHLADKVWTYRTYGH